MSERKLLVGFPAYGSVHRLEAMVAAMFAATDDSRADTTEVQFMPKGGSLLARNFNCLWVEALARAQRGECTHFAMLHDDIVPQPHWADLLIDAMDAHGLKMLAAVSPIKDRRGVTSTAVDLDGSRFHVRRITLHELWNDLPETFTQADTVAAGLNPNGGALLTNTGCWVADLRDERWYECDDAGRLRCYFTINDAVYVDGEKARVEVESEDWFFARQMAAIGIPYGATRCVGLGHWGDSDYTNTRAWGTTEHEVFPLQEVIAA